MAGGGIKINNTKVVGGANGKTPIFKIENGVLYNSYNNGTTWYELGQVKGQDGKDGQDGVIGAKLVKQELQGQDANGGNIYKQTFSDGTVAYFTAPKGDEGSITLDTTPTEGSQNPITSDAVYHLDNRKQDTLVDGVNIKTINNIPLTGAGNINIEGSGGSGGTITVDRELSDTSTNPVENKVITEELNKKQKQINTNQTQIQQLSQVLNTKPTTFTVSVNDTFSNGVEGAKWFDYEGNEITSQIGAGNYVDSNCRNNLFNSQETSVSILPYYGREYIIVREPVVNTPIEIDIKYVVITATQLMNIENKIIRIVEQEIPDRTGQKGATYYEIKGDLNDYSRYGTFTILASSWLDIADAEPFTHMTVTNGGGTLTADEINNKNCVLNLLNDQPLLFVKHGFQIRNIIAQDFGVFVNIMSIGAPTKDITFSFKGEVIE